MANRERATTLLRYEADIAFRRRAATIVDYLGLEAGELVVDAGCGLGFYLHLLASIVDCRLVGIEFAWDRLAAAAADRSFTKADLLRGDVCRLPLATRSVDRLILSEVLEHLRDPAAALQEVERVLRPGGVVAITVPHARYPFGWDPLNGVREALGLGHFTAEPWSGIWTDHQRLYTHEALQAEVAAAGLAVTDLHLETRYSAPFAHHLVYVAGKAIVERRRRSPNGGGARWDVWDHLPGPLMRAALGLFTLPDRLNAERYESGSAVSLCLRAVKP